MEEDTPAEISSSLENLLARREIDEDYLDTEEMPASEEDVSLVESEADVEAEPTSKKVAKKKGKEVAIPVDLEKVAQMSDPELDKARIKYSIPASFTMRRADAGESLVSTDPEWVALLVELFSKGGFRLPMHSFFEAFLNAHNIPPSAFSYNGWKVLGAFVALCKELGVEPTVRLFSLFYEVKLYKKGVFFASARSGMKIFANLDSTHPKRAKYFMCQPRGGWNIPTRWGYKKTPNFDPTHTAEEARFVARVKALAAHHVSNAIKTKDYCTPERMRDCGVYPPLEMDEETKQLMKRLADEEAREKAAAKAAGLKRKASGASSSAVAAQPVSTLLPSEPEPTMALADPAGGEGATGTSSPIEPEAPPPKKAKKSKGEAGSSSSKKDKKKKKKKKKKTNDDADDDDTRVGIEAEATDAAEEGQAAGELGEAQGGSRIELEVTDADTIQDDQVVRRYMDDMFTNRDWDRMVDAVSGKRNPFRILQSLGLELLLVSRGLEGRNHDTVQEARRLTRDLNEAKQDAASASTRADKAVERARADVASEIGELNSKLQEAESSRARAEILAKEASDSNLQLRDQLEKVQAELGRAQKEAEERRSAADREMSDLRAQLAESEKKLQEEGPKAVAAYLASEDFKKAKARAAVPAYTMGLQAYREVLVDTHPNWDLSQMDHLMPAALPDDMDDAPADGGGEEVAGGVAPAGDPSQEEGEAQPQDGVAVGEVVDLTAEPTGDQPGAGGADAGA